MLCAILNDATRSGPELVEQEQRKHASSMAGMATQSLGRRAARRSCPISFLRNVGSSYSEEPGAEILQHGEAHLRNEPVPGRLRRPP
jgi:hypothetical protein